MAVTLNTSPRVSFAQMLVRAQRRFVAARQVIDAARPTAALSFQPGHPAGGRPNSASARSREATPA
jgi:hypothetical protein